MAFKRNKTKLEQGSQSQEALQMQADLQTRSEKNAFPQNQKDHKQKQQKEKPKQHQQRQPNDRPQRNRRQRKPNKRTELQKSYSMLPNQHKNITQLLKPTNLTFTFHPTDDDDDDDNNNNNNNNNNNQTTTKVSKEHDTSITGKFHCRNTACSSNGWSSKAIPTTIRLYADNSYNARIYHQRCKVCNWLAKPVVTGGSYAERVSYWLKRWSGIEVERLPWGGSAGRPHVSELCEGCRVGRCRFARVGGEM